MNWLIGPLLSEANNRNCGLIELNVSARDLIELVNFVETEQVSNLSAKAVLTQMIDTKKSSATIVKEKNLIQISDESSLNKDIEEIIKLNPKSIEAFKAGKENAVMFLVGQVMKKTQGKANPKKVQEILRRRLQDA